MPRLLTALAGLLIGLPAAVVAAAGIYRHDVDRTEHEKLGSNPAFASVCAVLKDGVPSDSCVLVGSRWVLTAAHTVHLAQGRPLRAAFGDGRTFEVERSIMHPEFSWGVDFGVDLALLRLAESVSGIQPARFHEVEDELGRHVVLVGWGVFGGALDPDSLLTPSGRRRTAGYNTVDSISGLAPASDRSDTYLVMDFDHPDDVSLNLSGSATPLPLEFAFTGGDSGGGVFMDDNGSYTLVGIISVSEQPSRAREAPGRYGTMMYAVRITRSLEWLAEVLKDDR